MAHVLTSAGLEASWFTARYRGEQSFPWRLREKPLTVVASVSAARAHFYYEDPEAPSLDPRIRAEIDQLGRADGVLFVVDPQQARSEANLEALDNLRRDLASQGVDLDTVPVVFQVNKMDLDDLCSLEWVRVNLRVKGCDYVESIATRGAGTTEALTKLLELIEMRSAAR